MPENEPSILVVDDNPDDIEITKIALLEAGCTAGVETARCGEEALAYLRSKEELPILVMLDLKTAGMNGLETLRRIRADNTMNNLPVVVVTASSRETDKEEALNCGADGFLYKEFDIERFTTAIAALLQRLLAR